MCAKPVDLRNFYHLTPCEETELARRLKQRREENEKQLAALKAQACKGHGSREIEM